MTIKDLTIEQLKAMAYDQLVATDRAQANLKTINNEIALRDQEDKTPNDEIPANNTTTQKPKAKSQKSTK